MQFKLNKLNEAFADSMPDSIKNFLKNRSYIKAKLLGGKDIALDSVNFVKYPVPSSNRDPIFKDSSKMVFYLFGPEGKNGIYITGVNDDDRYLFNNKGDYVYNKYLSAKSLIEHSTEIYYIDLTDPNTFTADKKQTRKEYDLKNDPFTRHKIQEYPSYQQRDMMSKLDKSGYIKNPTKYTDKLVELGLYDPAKKTKKSFERLNSVKEDLIAALEDVSFDDMDSRQNLSAIRNAITGLDSAVSSYNDWLTNIERYTKMKNANQISNQDFAKAVSKNASNYESNIKYHLDRAQNNIEKYIGYAVDWDTDDEE